MVARTPGEGPSPRGATRRWRRGGFGAVLAAIAALVSTGESAGQLRNVSLPTGPYTPSTDPTFGLTAAYRIDSDKDGVVDALDPCPADPAVSTGAPSATIECYLGMSWLRQTIYEETKIANCPLAMAFPVADKTWDRKTPHRGVVLVGSQTDFERVALAAKDGLPWPSDASPNCLVSIDYEDDNGVYVFPEATTLASVYLTHHGDTLGGTFSPAVGLGVLTGDIKTVGTRNPRQPSLERLPWSRGVLFGPQILSEPPQGCVVDPTVSTDRCDPSKNGCLPRSGHVTCSFQRYVTPDKAVRPAGWRLIPRAMDRALRRDRAASEAAAADEPSASPLFKAIEDVPMVFEDDRWSKSPSSALRNAGTTGVALGSGGMVFGPGGGADQVQDPWIVLPAALARFKPQRRAFSFAPQAFRPSEDASYSKTRTGKSLVQQRFVIDSYGEPEVYVRSVEAAWPVALPTAAVAEANPRHGYRWSTNDSPHCWNSDGFWYRQTVGAVTSKSELDADYFQDWTINSSAGPSGVLATGFCPGTLTAWRGTTGVARNHNTAENACLNFTRGVSQFKADTQLTLVNGLYEGVCGGVHISVNVFTNAAECLLCLSSLGLFGDCDGCAPAGPVLDTISQCTVSASFDSAHDNMLNSDHWLDISQDRSLVPMTTYIRPTPETSPKDDPETWATWAQHSISSQLTPEDAFINHAHQGNDWNWVASSPGAIDPHYLSIAIRQFEDGSYQFRGIENELEFNVAMGEWDAELPDHDGSSADTHGYKFREYALGSVGKDVEWLGQIWPTQFCDLYGINRSKFGRPWEEAPSIPTSSCGDVTPSPNFFPAHWRSHFGRGIFAPYQAETYGTGEPAQMAVEKGWRPPTPNPRTVSLGLQRPEYWGQLPHRISFLGQPIADCGHDPYRVEIHPPHVITMDVAAYANGLVYSAFGWVNPWIDGHLEFDLWPPPRPSASSVFLFRGADRQLDQVASGSWPDFGYVIDNSGPSHVQMSPTLTCVPAPADFPNHLHCTYVDIAGNTHLYSDDELAHDNPRMLPKFASSRFDVRFWVGWQ